jgi:hypothetical protein
VRVAQSRSRRLLRGLAVATIASAPVLTLALPAHGEDILGAIDPPSTDVTTTTTVPEPAPLEGTPTTPPTDATTPTTDVTTPTTEAPTTDTTTAPDTTTTTEATTPTTVPDAVPVVPATNPPGGGSSGSTGSTRGGTQASGTATDTTKATEKDPALVLFTVGTPQDNALPLAGGGVQAVASLFTRPVGSAAGAITAVAHGTLSAAFGGDISPVSSDKTWGGLGSAGPRFAPWIVLLAMAWIVRTVIGSILADRTAGPRRRRWTLL